MIIAAAESTLITFSISTFFNEFVTSKANYYKRLLGSPKDRTYTEGKAAVAQFNIIADFIQFNDHDFYIVDTYNHLIRQYDRKNAETYHICGYRNASQSLDESIAKATFYQPTAIERYSATRYYIADGGTQAIRLLDFENNAVKTIFHELELTANFILLTLAGDTLYVGGNKLLSVNLKTNNVTQLLPFTPSSECLPVARESGSGIVAGGIAVLDMHCTLLISDTSSNTIKVLDRKRQCMHSLCNVSAVDYVTSNFLPWNQCVIKQPWTFHWWNESLVFVSSKSGIKALKCKLYIILLLVI